METHNREEGTHEELRSFSDMLSWVPSEDHTELDPLQDIFFAHSSSSELVPKNVNKNSDHRDTRDHCNKSDREAKRQRSMEYRVLMEKKRRQFIKDKVDLLHAMTSPHSAKSDLASKLDNIVAAIKSLKHQRDIMYMAAYNAGYMPPFYGAQAPCMSPYTTPWGYYAPGIPVAPYQNMPFIPQFHQGHETAPPEPNQTQ